ncbi:MAG: Eco57I restriction-modification methylase domain-containing protein [Pseudonocardiaceae bacterium]
MIDGIETDPAAAWLASVVLAAQALPLLAATPARRRQSLPALARLGDGLAPHDVRARLNIMNPPYGRVRLTDVDRERFASTLYGHANLYGLFLAAALDDLDEHGVIAALVPTSFMSGLYFQNLRRELGRAAPIREIGFVADRSGVFAGVLQETCLAIFGRRGARRLKIARLTGTGKSPVAQVAAPRKEGPWLLPRRSDDAIVAAASLSMPSNLRAAGWRASTGPLVWNRRKSDLSAESGIYRYPIIWAADIDGGRLHRDVVRDRLRYLTVHGSRDQSVILLTEPAILVQRTTAPEQSRRLVSVRLTAEQLDQWGGAVVVENHVNVLRSATVEPLVSIDTLELLLATEVFDRVMRSMSGSVAVSAYELESIPLPSADVLASWRELSGPELEVAVKSAFEARPG